MSATRYDMLAIDLDGTLLTTDGRVSQRNLDALHRARQAGIKIIICTGRGLVECRHVLDAIGQEDAVVVAGGSIVADPVRNATLHRFGLGSELVSRTTIKLIEHGYPVMVLKDPAEVGYDYLMVVGDENHPLDPVTRWWFETMRVRVRYAQRVEHDEHPEHTVRLGVCGLSGRMTATHDALVSLLADDVIMHHFPAVVAPDQAKRMPDGECLHILEVFSRQANKWSAITWAAAQAGIELSRIAAIGDQINDLSMIRGAQQAGGLGIAMGNAVEPVAQAAGRRTLANDDDGVAHAIDGLLAERTSTSV